MAKKSNQERGALRPSATQKQSSHREVDDRELRKRLGLAIRLARTAKGLTQRELASRIGKSQNFIYTAERGQTDPGLIALRRISDVLDVSMDVFIAPVVTQDKKRSAEKRAVFGKAQELLVSILKAVQDTEGGSRTSAQD